MQLISLKDFADKIHKQKWKKHNDCICIINDCIYDPCLADEICQKKIMQPHTDILLITKGPNNSIHYLKPFLCITYYNTEALEQLYQEAEILRSNIAHKKCIDLIWESLAHNLLQGTNLSMTEKHINVLDFDVESGGCILFKENSLSEIKKIQLQLFLYITKGSFCFFHEHNNLCIAFLFSPNHLEIADSKEIALFIHSLGIAKKDVGVSGVKYKFIQFHDAYIESLLDFDNQPNSAASILIQDNTINYTLSLLSEKMTRSLEERNVEALHQYIKDYMEFLFRLKSIHRIEVTIQLLQQLYERFYLIKNAQPIRDMIMEIEKNNKITSELNTIYDMLQKILNEMMNMMSEKGIEKNALINQIYEYIKVNYRQNIGLKEVADAFHVTPQYVCKLFSKYTSTNFSSLLTYFRIYHAKLLLKSGFTIKEVADVCGFHDVGYFMKKFKSVTGVTANAYKSNKTKY